jgi:hypothetical protein
MDKKTVACIHNRILYGLKMEKNPVILSVVTTQTNVENTMLSETICAQKDKYCMTSLKCGI